MIKLYLVNIVIQWTAGIISLQYKKIINKPPRTFFLQAIFYRKQRTLLHACFYVAVYIT